MPVGRVRMRLRLQTTASLRTEQANLIQQSAQSAAGSERTPGSSTLLLLVIPVITALAVVITVDFHGWGCKQGVRRRDNI